MLYVWCFEGSWEFLAFCALSPSQAIHGKTQDRKVGLILVDLGSRKSFGHESFTGTLLGPERHMSRAGQTSGVLAAGPPWTGKDRSCWIQWWCPKRFLCKVANSMIVIALITITRCETLFKTRGFQRLIPTSLAETGLLFEAFSHTISYNLKRRCWARCPQVCLLDLGLAGKVGPSSRRRHM